MIVVDFLPWDRTCHACTNPAAIEIHLRRRPSEAPHQTNLCHDCLDDLQDKIADAFMPANLRRGIEPPT